MSGLVSAECPDCTARSPLHELPLQTHWKWCPVVRGITAWAPFESLMLDAIAEDIWGFFE